MSKVINNELLIEDESTAASPNAIALADCPEIPKSLEIVAGVVIKAVKILTNLLKLTGEVINENARIHYGINFEEWRTWPKSLLVYIKQQSSQNGPNDFEFEGIYEENLNSYKFSE